MRKCPASLTVLLRLSSVFLAFEFLVLSPLMELQKLTLCLMKSAIVVMGEA